MQLIITQEQGQYSSGLGRDFERFFMVFFGAYSEVVEVFEFYIEFQFLVCSSFLHLNELYFSPFER